MGDMGSLARPFGVLLGLCVIATVGCASTPGADGAERDRRAATGRAQGAESASDTALSPAPVPRWLLVLRLTDNGIEVLTSRSLPAPLPGVSGASGSRSATRRSPVGWDGRYHVVDRHGRVLASGSFRIPRRVHALFDAVEGPAAPASVPLEDPLVLLRVDTPPGAAAVEIWDAGRRVHLGQVTL